MRPFLKHAFLFAFIILVIIAGYVWSYREYFPAPRLTRNVSLNEQMKRIKQLVDGDNAYSPDGKVNLLGVGSSMSLNNLNSHAVIEHFGDSNFVNVGAWSTRIDQTAKITAVLVDLLQPDTVLLTSNMEDWMNIPQYFTMDTTMLRNYLTNWSTAESYLRTLRPSYYLREMEHNQHRMTDPAYFDFLGFDPWGGATINVPPEMVTEDRKINTIPRPDQIASDQYPHLEQMAAHLKAKGVHLIFLQSPYRDGDQTEELRGIIDAHEQRVRQILLPYGHDYVSSTDESWPDELYIDPSHLKAEGAYQFTRYVLGKLKHPQQRSVLREQRADSTAAISIGN